MSIKTQILDTLKRLVGVYEQESFTEEQPAAEVAVVEETQVEENFQKVYSESEIKISQYEIGGKVELIDAGGELLPAEDGDYELTDGRKFTVKDGQIAAIEGQEAPSEEEQPATEEPTAEEDEEEPAQEAAPVEEPIEEVVEETPTEEVVEEEPTQDPVITTLQDKVAELAGIIEGLVQTIEDLKGSTATKDELTAFSTQVETLDQSIQKLAKLPVQMSQTSTNHLVKESKEAAQMEWMKILARK